MMISELIKTMKEIYDKNGDAEIFVDTKGAKFECHWVAITGCYEGSADGMTESFITLDNNMKIYGTKDKEENNG